MNLRAKLLLVFVTLALLPLVALSAFNYRSGLRAVEGLVREAAEDREARTAQRLETLLAGREDRLVLLAKSPPLRDFVRGARAAGEARAGAKPPVESEVEKAAREYLRFFYRNNRAYYQTITILDSSGVALCQMIAVEGADDGEPHFQTREEVVTSGVRYDQSVWRLTEPKALRSPLSHEGTPGTILGTTVPVFAAEGGTPAGALFVEIRLKEILEDAARSGTPREGAGGVEGARHQEHVVLALDNDTGLIVYHTKDGLMHHPASSAMPSFEGVAARMRAGGAGTEFYSEPDGNSWLAAYRQVRGLKLSLAAAENYTAASADVRRAGLLGLALAAAAGLAAVALLLLIVRRTTSRIGRVAHAASAIAGGDLDHRIEIEKGGDEMSRLEESFNLMSDRLREHIRRESESKQFESFMRLSAMLTHDLKNAITGLSMLVSNMEVRFDRQEFRADAVLGLREATEKLNRIVSRLSEPMRSLSGEYRRDARPTDLVPVIRRVLAEHAEPSRPLYEIEARLPDKLVATVEPERVENVIENLVINALEAMGAGGGRLTVEAGEEGERNVFVSVADTGIGMSEEFLKTRLFRPFSTTKTRGVGLGLFTCKEIVETHGGRLEVESKLGAGTRFRVVLPSSLFKSGERHGRTSKGASADGRVEPGAPK